MCFITFLTWNWELWHHIAVWGPGWENLYLCCGLENLWLSLHKNPFIYLMILHLGLKIGILYRWYTTLIWVHKCFTGEFSFNGEFAEKRVPCVLPYGGISSSSLSISYLCWLLLTASAFWGLPRPRLRPTMQQWSGQVSTCVGPQVRS